MAIQGAYTTSDGVSHPSAYLRVSGIDLIAWDGKTAVVNIAMYHDQTCRNQGKDEVYSESLNIQGAEFDAVFDETVLSTKTPRASIYDNYLKLQPEYSGWTDV